MIHSRKLAFFLIMKNWRVAWQLALVLVLLVLVLAFSNFLILREEDVSSVLFSDYNCYV